MRRKSFFGTCLACAVVLALAAPLVSFGADEEIIFDDYVEESASENGAEASAEELEAEGGLFASVSGAVAGGDIAGETAEEGSAEEAADDAGQVSQEEVTAAVEEAGVDADASVVTEETDSTLFIYDEEEALAENTDGDDTYVSNTGQVFTIPRVNAADGVRVYDWADLFTEEELADLQERIGPIADKKNADILILTSRDVPMDASYGMETTRKYTEQFYLDNFWGGVDDEGDALIFMIDMGNRVLWTMGHGKYADEKYVKYENEVYDAAMSKAKNGNYYAAAGQFLEKTKRLDNILYKILPSPISLVLSSILSLVAMVLLNLKHKSSQPSKANTPRIRVNQYKKLAHNSRFLGTRVSRRTISRESSGGGGGFSGGTSSGGGFSGGGGGFSGGGGHF